jgi:hypothetical protein
MTIEKKPESARQGRITGHMRWVLGISIALAVVGLAIVAFSIGS